MLLHFIFLVERDEIESRTDEFNYSVKMARFFKSWIMDCVGRELDVRCDRMAVDRRGIWERPGVHTLLADHLERGESTWHFYLTNFRPLWTDSLSEGYHSENMCMSMWLRPRGGGNDPVFMAEKNCTAVSYELAHELLRQRGNRNAVDMVNDVWAKHFSGALAFAAYGEDHTRTDGAPTFLTIDPSFAQHDTVE